MVSYCSIKNFVKGLFKRKDKGSPNNIVNESNDTNVEEIDEAFFDDVIDDIEDYIEAEFRK